MVGLLLFLLFGAIVGYIARFLMPGRDRLGCIGTTLLGAAGSIVGGVLFALIFGEGIDLSENSLFQYRMGWIGSIIGALIVLAVARALSRR